MVLKPLFPGVREAYAQQHQLRYFGQTTDYSAHVVAFLEHLYAAPRYDGHIAAFHAHRSEVWGRFHVELNAVRSTCSLEDIQRLTNVLRGFHGR